MNMSLREYDTVARADNYFAEYRMLFLRRHSNIEYKSICKCRIEAWVLWAAAHGLSPTGAPTKLSYFTWIYRMKV